MDIEKLNEEIYLKSSVQAKIIPLRHDLPNGRWYESNEVFKPSVTSFLHVLDKGIGFMKWLGNATSFDDAMAYSEKRADIGSKLHTMFANMIFGATINTKGMEEEIIKRILQFKQFWLQANPTPIATEYPMWHEDIPYAGTADMICNIENKKGDTEKWLLDWKTGGIWSDYKYQISAYKYLAEKCFNFKIDRCALVQFKGSHRATCTVDDKPKYKFIEIKPLEYRIIENIYELWQIENKNPKPKFPTEYPEEIILEQST